MIPFAWEILTGLENMRQSNNISFLRDTQY